MQPSKLHAQLADVQRDSGVQVKEQMEAFQEQMKRPEVQQEMELLHALRPDQEFALKVEKLRVSA